ncbi:MAG: hypothetical protein E7256_07655 [Lachnospiraceae bacterium]|nr:hypothetical protein [Lachnospiraceae bacterium]
MKSIKRIFMLLIAALLISGMMTACGKDSKPTGAKEDQITNMPNEKNEEENQEKKENQEKEESEEKEGEEKQENQERPRLIEEQTFDVELAPLGKVHFEAYEPDLSENFLADVTFIITKDGKTVSTLPGVYENNIRPNEMFNMVEAVSFIDYNQDMADDIIIICNYSPSAGPDIGTGYAEVRIYSGSADGNFTYEAELSQTANEALAEKTIQSVKDFIGVGRTENLKGDFSKEDSSWKQAYIDYIQSSEESGQWQGYALIYIDADDIPEIAEVGSNEAMGCKILNYADGEVKETQLSRLGFTYIEKENLLCNSDGNMDFYYDLIYSIIDGNMTLIASGYYGAEDNSKLEFDEQGEIIYQYRWNDVLMEKEEYEKALNAVYDTSKAVPGYNWEELYLKDQIVAAIEQIGE